MEKTEGNLHWQIVQNLMEGFDEDRALTEIADDICSIISARIKAKALTDERLSEVVQRDIAKWDLNCHKDFIMDTARASATAQLQAVLKELDIKENK